MTESEEEQMQKAAWGRIRARLRAAVGENAFDLWLSRLQFEFIHNKIFVCSLPTQSLVYWARNHYEAELFAAAQAEYKDESLEKVAILHRKLGQPLLPPKEKAAETDDDPDPIIGTPYRMPEQPTVPPQQGARSGIDSLVVTQAEAAARTKDATLSPEGRIAEPARKKDDRSFSMKAVADVLCEYFKLPFEELSSSRLHETVRVRDLTILIIRKLCRETAVEIGRFFGGRTPNAIYNSLNKAQELLQADTSVASRISNAEAYVRYRLQETA